ncbi:MAG: guanylate kinase [Acidocella sp. 20-63-7]|nr:MAG: guanylate kinase [Acidocella sp. 20-63-7]HQT45774.1 guanylate kinase [Acidocella sp.]
MSKRRGLCLVFAAPSGAGKTTLSRALLAEDANLSLSISVTTRSPRTGEIDGEHYHFITQPEFDEMVSANQLLEHAHVFGRSYGTPRDQIEQALADSRDILFDIDWQGFRQLQSAMPHDVVGVFIKPPSLKALHQRLINRGDAPEQITRRMAEAENELAHAHEFDYLIENATFDIALADLRAILRASRLATHRVGK